MLDTITPTDILLELDVDIGDGTYQINGDDVYHTIWYSKQYENQTHSHQVSSAPDFQSLLHLQIPWNCL